MADRFVATPGRLDAVVAACRRRLARRCPARDHGWRGHGRRTPPSAVVPTASAARRSRSSSPSPAPSLPGGAPVEVRYRDEALAIVVKPAGVLTHPTAAHRDDTLVNRLLAMGIPLAPAGGPLRPGIVHRLDAGTSGLLIVACTDAAYTSLQAMLRRHAVDRRYLALARGAPTHDDFQVEAPLGRREARIVVDRVGGRDAATGFTVRERLAAHDPARGRPTDGPHPPDPGPPPGDRAPDRRRRALRRRRGRGAPARSCTARSCTRGAWRSPTR